MYLSRSLEPGKTNARHLEKVKSVLFKRIIIFEKYRPFTAKFLTIKGEERKETLFSCVHTKYYRETVDKNKEKREEILGNNGRKIIISDGGEKFMTRVNFVHR